MLSMTGGNKRIYPWSYFTETERIINIDSTSNEISVKSEAFRIRD